MVIVLWLVYAIWYAPRKDAWQFIPDNAFLVIESSAIQGVLYTDADSVARPLSEIPFLNDATERLRELTKDLHPEKETKPLLNNKLISYSIHREAKSNLEYITYLPLLNNGKQLLALRENNASNKRLSTQKTKGIEIIRVRPNDDNIPGIAYFIHDGYLVCSRSVILLEAVVNKITSRSPALDKTPFTESRQGLAHFYFRTRNLLSVADLLPTQLSPNLRSYFRNTVPFNPDLVFTDNEATGSVTGYVASKTKIEVPFISAFASQRASAFTATEWIPENTAFFLRTSFDKPTTLSIGLNVHLKEKDARFFSMKDSVNTLLQIDVNDVFKFLGKEVMLCEMETAGDENAQRIAILHAADIANLSTLTEQFGKAAEKYQPFKTAPFRILNHTVQKLEINEFPALLFGSTFSGFSTCYFSSINNYFIVANSQEAMVSYLTNISLGKTWANSTKHQELRAKLNKNAQITAIINPKRIWNNLFYSLPPSWQKSTLKHERRFKNMELLAVENIAFKDRFGTKIHIQKNTLEKQRYDNKLLLQRSITAEDMIVGSPRIMPNLASNSEEIVLKLPNSLQLFNAKGNSVAKLAFAEELNDQNMALDFYQNDRLQYLVTTRQQAFILDRKQNKIVLTEVYQNPRTHIIAAATHANYVFLVNQAGEVYSIAATESSKIPLKKKINQASAIALIKQDNLLLLALTETDGTLHLFYTHNGVEVRGFPVVVTEGRPVKIITTSNPKESPKIQVISDLGEVKLVGIDGLITTSATLQLPRRSRNAIFEVIFDQQNRDWLITQRDPSGVIIYRKNGEQLLEIQTPFYENLNVKFFDLGNDLRIITIFDGKTTLLYDLSGQQIGDKPLDATAPPYLTFEANYNKLLIYNPNGNVLEKWGVKVE